MSAVEGAVIIAVWAVIWCGFWLAVAIFVPDEGAPSMRESTRIALRIIGRWVARAGRALVVAGFSPRPAAPRVLGVTAARVPVFPAGPAWRAMMRAIVLQHPATGPVPEPVTCPGSVYPHWPVGGFAAWVEAGEDQ